MSELVSLLLDNTSIQGSVTSQRFWLTLLVPSILPGWLWQACPVCQGYRNDSNGQFSGGVGQVFAYCTPVIMCNAYENV